MSRARWTDEQRAAIDHRGGNLLLSAAAGAGKTAVLVERVIQLITDRETPTSIERLLVVTFTEAAAAEMKGRIRQALADRLAEAPDRSWLRRQTALVNRASISTLHAFCLRLLRADFHRLGLDPAFRVIDEQEAELLRQEVLEALFESKYEAGEDDFTGLCDRYGGTRGDEGLRRLVLRAYDFSRSVAFPEAWLAGAAARFDLTPGTRLGGHPWGQAALEEVALAVDRADGLLRVGIRLAGLPGGPGRYAAALEGDRQAVAALRESLETGDWGAIYESFNASTAFGRLPPVGRDEADPDLKETVRKAREGAKKVLADVRAAYFGRPGEDLLGEIAAVGPWIHHLVGLVNDFARAYRQHKASRAQLDFSDLEHYAVDLLVEAEGRAEAEALVRADPGDQARALATLRPSDLGRELRSRFDEVLVDEYQDINGVQEALLHLISRQGEVGRSNLFMVGDVKQSIYRFRLADPGIFDEKRRRYGRAGEQAGDQAVEQAAADGRALDLTANFRSASGVIEAVNFIFRKVMAGRVGQIDYGDDHALQGKADYGGHPTPPGPIEVHLIERDGEAGGVDDGEDGDSPDGTDAQPFDGGSSGEFAEDAETEEDMEAAEREAVFIAERIRAMVVGGEFSVRDRESGEYRPVRFRDIAVILRATKERANRFQDVFNRYDIPVHAQSGTGYFEATEVEVMLSLLRVIDNPRQDIPLLAALRSPIGGFDETDLAAIRLADRTADFYGALVAAAEGKAAEAVSGDDPAVGGAVAAALGARCRAFLDRLDDWRTRAHREGLGDLVWRLYRDTGYLAFVGGLPGGAQRRANLLALHGRAGQFDRFAVQGLSRFLKFIERLRETQGDLGTARAAGEDEDVVRIISAHGSKGLEFPVVILADLGHLFNLNDLKADWLFHRELGFGPYLVDPERRLAYPTLAWLAIRGALSLETLAEEMRILYVAMTRARERLILVASRRGLQTACRSWVMGDGGGGSLPDHQLAAARCWLDWIGMALSRHPDGSALRERADLPEGAAGGAVASENDQSRWTVQIHGRSAEDALKDAAPAGEQGLPWAALADLRPVPFAVTRAAAPDTQVSPAPAVEPGDADLTAAIARRLAWSYPMRPATVVAAKVSVSEFLRGPSDRRRGSVGTDETAVGADEEAAELAPAGRRPADWRRPAFADEGDGRLLTGSERGSATHLALQNLDLSGSLDVADLRSQLDRMTRDMLLTEEQAAAVDLPSLANFWRSELGQAIRAAGPRARREVPFTLALPAEQVYPEASVAGESILVQGIIDCLLDEEAGYTVVDFKTDRLPAEAAPAAAEGYRRQLALYAEAVRTITGRPVIRTLLVFLHSGSTVKVDPR